MTENATQKQSWHVTDSTDIDDMNLFAQREMAIAKLKKSQIKFPVSPEIPAEWQDEDGDFKMPDDLTKLTIQDLGRLMSLLNSLLLWYGAVLASARIDALTAERIKNFVESKVRMRILSNKEMEKTYKAREDKDAYVNLDSNVRKAQEWFDRAKSIEIMAEQLYLDYDRSFRLVSREISRRSGENWTESREHKVSNLD